MLIIFWAASLAALLVSCSAGPSKAAVTITMERTGQLYNISFSRKKFEDFQDCMCDDDDARCIAEYEYDYWSGPGYCVSDIEDEGEIHSSEQDSRCYICTSLHTRNELVCTHYSRVPNRCDGVVGVQSFQILNSECGSTCLTLMWTKPGEKIVFNPGSYSTEDCYSNCGCPTTRPTTKPPPTRSTTKPSPTRPTTKPPPTRPTTKPPPTRPTTKPPPTRPTTKPPPTRPTTKPPRPPPTRPPTPTHIINEPTVGSVQGSNSADENMPLVGVIIGLLVAIVVLTAIIVIGVICWRRRRTFKEQQDVILPCPKSKKLSDDKNIRTDVQATATGKTGPHAVPNDYRSLASLSNKGEDQPHGSDRIPPENNSEGKKGSGSDDDSEDEMDQEDVYVDIDEVKAEWKAECRAIDNQISDTEKAPRVDGDQRAAENDYTVC